MPDLPTSLSFAQAYWLGGERDRHAMTTPRQPADVTGNGDRHPEDARLMRCMAEGDRAAFAALYDRFSRPLFATALRMLNDSREAEDVVQEVFLSLWEKSGDFESTRGTAFGWAVTLTRNRAIDRIRTRKRRAELLSDAAPHELGYEEAGSSDSADALASAEQSTAVRAAVARLPAEQQRALELAFFSGLTQQEIASQLQEPLGTIKARIRRGLLKLRDSLAPRP